MFGWRKRKKIKEKAQADKKDKDICPDCSGKGYCVNENHYIADSDYSRHYSPCRRCNGTGNYHSNIDKL